MKKNNGLLAYRTILSLMLTACTGLITWTANTTYTSSIRLSVIETTLSQVVKTEPQLKKDDEEQRKAIAAIHDDVIGIKDYLWPREKHPL